ncbi:hypothetical protein ABPG75_010439 [Micractinium tetrahymenae]
MAKTCTPCCPASSTAAAAGGPPALGCAPLNTGTVGDPWHRLPHRHVPLAQAVVTLRCGLGQQLAPHRVCPHKLLHHCQGCRRAGKDLKCQVQADGPATQPPSGGVVAPRQLVPQLRHVSGAGAQRGGQGGGVARHQGDGQLNIRSSMAARERGGCPRRPVFAGEPPVQRRAKHCLRAASYLRRPEGARCQPGPLTSTAFVLANVPKR